MNSRTTPFDELDRKIITALMANARTSFAEIGAAIGLSSTAVKRRVDRLRDTGVITGFTATVQPAALGWRTEADVEGYCEGAGPPRRPPAGGCGRGARGGRCPAAAARGGGPQPSGDHGGDDGDRRRGRAAARTGAG